jgi:hypothetical protein
VAWRFRDQFDVKTFQSNPPAGFSDSKILDAWLLRAVRAANGHYESARQFEWKARWLSIAALLTTLLAAVLTALILALPDVLALRIVTAITATAATGLGLLQTQLDLAGRADRHRMAGSGYSRVRRDIEGLSKVRSEVLHSKEFRDLEHLYSEVSKNAPTIPGKVWSKVLREYPKTDDEMMLRARRSGD